MGTNDTTVAAGGDDTLAGGAGDDTLACGAPEETLVSRDERADSIDPATGALTDEALALRRAAAAATQGE